jgi:hypothetical protein
MKKIKFGLRIWLAIVSLFSFLTGWILFAHSNKPAPLLQSQPAEIAPFPAIPAALPALPSLNNPSQLLSQPQVRQAPSFLPRLRTGGS